MAGSHFRVPRQLANTHVSYELAAALLSESLALVKMETMLPLKIITAPATATTMPASSSEYSAMSWPISSFQKVLNILSLPSYLVCRFQIHVPLRWRGAILGPPPARDYARR